MNDNDVFNNNTADSKTCILYGDEIQIPLQIVGVFEREQSDSGVAVGVERCN